MSRLLCILIFTFITSMILKGQNSLDVASYAIGTWEWEETELVSRGGGSKTTPASCNCTRTLILDENGVMRQYENGELIAETSFEIKKIQFLDDPVRFQFRSTKLSGTIIKIDSDRLGVGAFGSCGQIHYYKRKNLEE